METLRLFTQGMEVDNPDPRDSEPEDEGQPDNDADKRAGGEEEDEEGVTGEEQQENTDEEDWHTCSEDEVEEGEGTSRSSAEPSFHNSSRLLHKDELLDMFKAAHKGPRCKDGQLTVGLVGKLSALYSAHTVFWFNQLYSAHSKGSSLAFWLT